jgi:hypothetical protein
MKTICSNCQEENELNSKYCSICGFKLPIIENQNNDTKIELREITTKNKKFNLKTFAGFIVGFIIMFLVIQLALKPSIEKQLPEMVIEMNKNCPLKVDEYTTLENIVVLPNKTVQYNHILIGITKAEVNLDTVKKYVYPGILEKVKSHPGMKIFRDNKFTLIYSYNDQNGEFVNKYVIKPEMYE